MGGLVGSPLWWLMVVGVKVVEGGGGCGCGCGCGDSGCG